MSTAMNVLSVIGFGMSTTFIIVCIKRICYMRQDSESIDQTQPTIDLEEGENGGRGLDPVMVCAIPSMEFQGEAFSLMEDAQCSICLIEYEEKDILRRIPKCGHTFHVSCIDEWLRQQHTCPVCRLSLHHPFLLN